MNRKTDKKEKQAPEKKIYKVGGKDCVHLTNSLSYNPATGEMNGHKCKAGFLVGPPAASEVENGLTVQQLTAIGMIGVYEEVEKYNERMKQYLH